MTTSSTPDNRPVIYIDDKDLEEGLRDGTARVKSKEDADFDRRMFAAKSAQFMSRIRLVRP